MTTRPMTDRQRIALAYMAGKDRGQACGDDLKDEGIGDTRTMWQLEARGFVKLFKVVHFAHPEISQFRITGAGRAALN